MESNSIHCSRKFLNVEFRKSRKPFDWVYVKVIQLLLLLVPCAVSAQNINDCQWYTCGTGTSTTYNTPVNNFYNYSFVEMLFLANELSGDEGTIYKIGFQYGYSSAMTSKTNVKIYMKNVTVNALTSGTIHLCSNNVRTCSSERDSMVSFVF